MKKNRKILYNIVTILLVIVAIANAGYLAIPIEWQEKYVWLASINVKLVAIVMFLTSASMSVILIWVQNWAAGREKFQDDKYNVILTLQEQLTNNVINREKGDAAQDKRYRRIEQSVLRMEKAISAMVNSRLENPFLTEETEEELEKVKEEIDSEVIEDVEE